MSFPYTVGNWSVSKLTTDSITTQKTLSITDLNYKVDFAKSEDEPAEAVVKNTTSTAMASPEQIRYGRKDVANVYAGTQIKTVNQPADKTGVQAMVELKFNLRAVNSVSAAEVDLPFTVRTVVIVPSATSVTDEAVEYAIKRGIAALLNTGKVDGLRIKEIIRGSLLPL